MRFFPLSCFLLASTLTFANASEVLFSDSFEVTSPKDGVGINDGLGTPRQGGTLIQEDQSVVYDFRKGPANDENAARLEGQGTDAKLVFAIEAGASTPSVSPRHNFVGHSQLKISWTAWPQEGAAVYLVVGTQEQALELAPRQGVSVLALPGLVQVFVRGRQTASVPVDAAAAMDMQLQIQTPKEYDGRGLARMELTVNGKSVDMDSGSSGAALVTQGLDQNWITLGGHPAIAGKLTAAVGRLQIEGDSVPVAAPTNAARVEDFSENFWIWEHGGPPKGEFGPGRTGFRQSFEITNPADISQAAISFVGTFGGVIKVNGKEVASHLRPSYPYLGVSVYPLPKELLQAGKNVLSIDITHPNRGSAGIMGNLYFLHEDGRGEVQPINTSAKVSSALVAGWEELDFNDTEWKNAGTTGPNGSWDYWMGWMPPVNDPRFPDFIVPGQEREMAEMREIFHKFYFASYASSALWDQWMPTSLVWPAIPGANADAGMGALERDLLLGRKMGEDGWIATQQHLGLGHSEGWPFPKWTQSSGMGWHFSLDGIPYRAEFGIHLTTTVDSWKLENAKTLALAEPEGWTLELGAGESVIESPEFAIKKRTATFVRIDWLAPDFPAGAKAWLEWTTQDEPEFSPDRQLEIRIPAQGLTLHEPVMIEMPKDIPLETILTRFRLRFDLPSPGTAIIKHLITVNETRHSVNNPSFLIGFCDYLNWTGDLDMLRSRMVFARRALTSFIEKYSLEEEKMAVTPDIGMDGRSGFYFDEAGQKVLIPGQGIGNNYWDILPFGGRDVMTTYLAYAALGKMADLEEWIAKHPEAKVPTDGKLEPAALRKLAADIKQTAAPRLFNEVTGRFPATEDNVDGVKHDYGYVFVNNEAIYYDFATPEQARSIRDWIDGKRVVEGDTSTGEDIYNYRFAPRMTTKRNVEWYIFPWYMPESIPWGGQVQDGGSVLGFTYHDIMARLKVNGADDAWERTKEVLQWHDDVMKAGGFREYYSAGENKEGSLQGGGIGTGGLGILREFIESVLFPQVMIRGFLGLHPTMNGLKLEPQLPGSWPSFTLTRIRWHGGIYTVKAEQNGAMEVIVGGGIPASGKIFPRSGEWQVIRTTQDGKTSEARAVLTDGQGIDMPSASEVSVRLVPQASANNSAAN